MVLRGVCTMRDSEIHWMFGGGAGALKPWAWQRFLDHLGDDPADRANPLLAYYARLLSPDANVRDAAVSLLAAPAGSGAGARMHGVHGGLNTCGWLEP